MNRRRSKIVPPLLIRVAPRLDCLTGYDVGIWLLFQVCRSTGADAFFGKGKSAIMLSRQTSSGALGGSRFAVVTGNTVSFLKNSGIAIVADDKGTILQPSLLISYCHYMVRRQGFFFFLPRNYWDRQMKLSISPAEKWIPSCSVATGIFRMPSYNKDCRYSIKG